jgi:sulfur carrier protein ThiS
MKAEILFSAKDLVGNLRDGAYELPENASVAQLIEAAERGAGEKLSGEVRENLIFLVNSRPAGWDTVLREGDRVRVLFKILGG